jgi:cytochrome P450
MADDAPLNRLSPAVPKPGHVPDALVYDFDKYADPALREDPHARMLDLIKNAPPIFWTPRRGGCWMLTSYEAVFECARDFDTFTNAIVPQEYIEARLATMPDDAPHIPTMAPSTVDPPLHAIYRLPLNSVFSPKRINLLKDNIRTLARELLAEVESKGHCEFMAAVAEPLPVQIFLKIFGLPVERWKDYRDAVKEMLSGDGTNPENSIRRAQQVAAIMRPTMEERRQDPQDDIISMLWQTTLDGRPTAMADMEDYGVMLFVAGLDTVMNGMGIGVRYLAMNPDLQDQLRADPALIPKATEEMLRRFTFTVLTRTLKKDAVFQGVEMKKGDICNVFLPAADLDPVHFDQPERFDMNRDIPHVAFGVGPHRCLGSHLARVELEILYEELLAALPRFRLDPQKPPPFHGGHIIGPDTLHLLWDV